MIAAGFGDVAHRAFPVAWDGEGAAAQAGRLPRRSGCPVESSHPPREGVSRRRRPRSVGYVKARSGVVPVVAGAVAATAVALLVGWPGRAPLTATAAVAAAVASGVVAVLFIVGIAAAARRPARPGRAPATSTCAVGGPVEAADAVTEPIGVAMVGPVAANAGSAGSSSSSSPSAAGAAVP